MSTRCQVKLIEEWLNGQGDTFTVYRHSGGYPRSVIEDIKKAYEISGGRLRAGRAGNAASYLCASAPGVFEPEKSEDLHGDILYYYKLYLVNNSKRFAGDAKPYWEVEIFKIKVDRKELRFKGLKRIKKRTKLEDIDFSGLENL